jgi:hypothetical protein
VRKRVEGEAVRTGQRSVDTGEEEKHREIQDNR